jgi:hypothetical protein
MCSFSRPSPPPAPEPIPVAPPSITNATTKKDAPKMATSSSATETNTAMKKRRGRGSLRIPLTSSGLNQSGVNFPTA